MIRLSEQQRGERWDSLPDTLRDAIVSETNSDFIWKTCQAEFIPEEKIYDVLGTTGLVLSGFLHPEDMAAEIAAALGIDRRIADVIASAINQRIFVPLRPEIDAVYDPTGQSATPVMLDGAVLNVPMPPPAPAQIFAQGLGSGVATGTGAGTAVSDKGWSSLRASVVADRNQPPTPVPITVAPRNPPMQPAPAPAPTPTPTPMPRPSMLVQRADAPKPIQNAPNFRAAAGMENVLAKQQAVPIPPKPIILEMAGMPRPSIGKNPNMPMPRPAVPQAFPPKAPMSVNASTSKLADVSDASPKTVHYGGPISSLPIELPVSKPTPEVGRNITEVTADQKQAPTMPTPPPSAAPKAMPLPRAIPVPTMSTPKPQAIPTPPKPATAAGISGSPMMPAIKPMPIASGQSFPQSGERPVPKPVPKPIPGATIPVPVPKPATMQVPKPGTVIVKDFKEGV